MKKVLSIFLTVCLLAVAGGDAFAQGRVAKDLPRDARVERGSRHVSGQGYHDKDYLDYPSYGYFYFGLRCGLSVSSVWSDASALDGRNPVTGLSAGMAFGTLVSGPMDFETGLYYVEKGGKSSGDAHGDFTYDLNYLEVPFVLKYNYFFNPELALQPLFGGYVSLGAGGKIRDYDNRHAFSSFSDGYFRHGDAGLRLGCGLAARMFYFEAVCDLGLANVGKDDFDRTRTRCFSFSIGLNF